VILVLALLVSSPSFAGDTNNGEAFLERCDVILEMGKQGGVLQGAENKNFMYCMGYFNAVIGMYNNIVLLDNYKATPYCLPMGSMWKQIAETVIVFLKKHPELSDQPAETITNMALSETFPCSKEISE
jgi:hypothetical protein